MKSLQQGDKDTLERVHEKAVKMVSGLKSGTCLERCEELKLDTLEKRREDQDLALAHKMIMKERFQNNMVLWTVGENTRAATRMASEPKNLITQSATTELRKASFAIRVTEPWNTLPTELKMLMMARHSRECGRTTSNTAEMGGRQYGRKEERQDRTSLPHRGPISPQHAYLAYSG
jgi:hypothetical protein